MSKVLVLLYSEQNGSLAKSGLEAVGAAKTLAESLGGSLLAGLFGGEIEAAANSIGGCGAEKILGVSGADFAAPRYGTDAAAAEAIAKAAGADIILVPGTLRMNRILAGVAHRLGGRADSHVTALSVEGGVPTISRWYYRQRMMGRVQRDARPWVIAIDPGAFAPWQGSPAPAAIEPVSVPVPDSLKRTRVEGVVAPDVGEQTIRPDADLLFVAGAGWTKKQADGQPHVQDAEQAILGFLRASKASLGSSKSLVDVSGEGQAVLSFLTHMNQVGQTGATPRHPKGLATCCHGEEPHAVGWRFITERRAINLDANCGWAQGKADVLYVADAFAVMKKVNELLTQ